MRDAAADLLPPSSRSGAGPRAGYAFETAAALVRHGRWSFEDARRLASGWGRYIDARRRNGKTPLSTAEHISRFERLRLARPPARDSDGRGDDDGAPLAALAIAQHARELEQQGHHEEAAALRSQARSFTAPRERGAQSARDPDKYHRRVERFTTVKVGEGLHVYVWREVDGQYEGRIETGNGGVVTLFSVDDKDGWRGRLVDALRKRYVGHPISLHVKQTATRRARRDPRRRRRVA